MRYALKTFAQAPGENLAAPDRAVIAIAGSVETDADDALVPRAPLGEHGSDVCAMMLHGALFPSGKIRGMHRRNILRM
jgi:hypothetical protein